MSHLVAMTKNGETLAIHPDLVGAHERLGWVTGYLAANYPPDGYASRSTPEEIAEAVAAQAGNGKIDLGTDSGDGLSDDELRGAIEAATGQKPHHMLGRVKLVEQFNELNAKAATE